MPLGQAEVHVELLSEALAVNLENLVTKDYFDAKLSASFAEHNASIDARFAEHNASIDTRFAEQTTYIDKRFAEQQSCIDTRLAQLEAKVDKNHSIFLWTQSIVVIGVFLPWLERFFLL